MSSTAIAGTARYSTDDHIGLSKVGVDMTLASTQVFETLPATIPNAFEWFGARVRLEYVPFEPLFR